jgi:leucyl aminopeptidase
MHFEKAPEDLWKSGADVLVVGIFLDEKIEPTLNELAAGAPTDFLKTLAEEGARESFTGKTGQLLALPTYGKIAAQRICLIGLGKQVELTASGIRKASAVAARKFGRTPKSDSKVLLSLRFNDDAAMTQAAVEGWLLATYQFKKYKTKDEDNNLQSTHSLLLFVPQLQEKSLLDATARGASIADATNSAREMIAEPPAVMTPGRLAGIAAEMASPTLSCQIIDHAEAESMGMGAFLGVAKGAVEPPKFIVLRYIHEAAKKTIALAGKGITFDSGGLSIKNAQSMENMKYDMSGAAVVIATMKAMSELKPHINIIAVAAATENMPSGSAMHPGDVIKALNGKTIEVNNTDAEGRLVLADALSYLLTEKPDELIDVATLTGACVTALGRAAAGIMGNNDALVNRIISSGKEAGEKYWQLPLFDEYKEALKSDIADLKNAGARGEAGASAAGMFLKEFVDGQPWAHLDIAGPGWLDKDKDELNKGGTAFGVRTLCYYILSQAKA